MELLESSTDFQKLLQTASTDGISSDTDNYVDDYLQQRALKKAYRLQIFVFLLGFLLILTNLSWFRHSANAVKHFETEQSSYRKFLPRVAHSSVDVDYCVKLALMNGLEFHSPTTGRA